MANTPTGWEPRRRVIRMMTTRLTTLTTGERVRFAKEDLDGFAEAVHSTFIPSHIEHLTYLPPVGRISDAWVVQADDGEYELYVASEELPSLGPSVPPLDPLDLIPDGLEEGRPDIEASVLVEPRNFEDSAYPELVAEAPLPVAEENRWASLPPLEWVIALAVSWGAVRFAGSFLDAAGRSAWEALCKWIATWSAKAKAPDRDRLITLRFELPGDAYVSAHVVVASDDPDAEATIRAALDSAVPIAEFVGAQVEHALIPGLSRAAFVYEAGTWRLVWFVTDGDRVYVNSIDDLPDPARLLGRPLLGGDAPGRIGPSAGFGNDAVRGSPGQLYENEED
jgi:hypothetical protein